MSYAIIRNINYKMGQLSYAYRHNERKNTNYSNKDIQHKNSIKNYSLKNVFTSYQKAFKNIKEKYKLKGQIKIVSNVMCELLITSDKEFFETIGEEETRRYFECAYKFVANYQNLGEEFIVSAKIHMDESTPHMHLVYIPVVHKTDKKSGKEVSKIACSEYWKGKDSYGKLQDSFYEYITKCGFDLERGRTKDNEHIPIEKLKVVTNYEMQELFKESEHLEQEIVTKNFKELQVDYKRVIKKFNTLAKQYTRVKTITDNMLINQEKLQQENEELKEEITYLEEENNRLNNFLEKTYEYVSILFNFPKDRLKRLVKSFVDKMKGE